MIPKHTMKIRLKNGGLMMLVVADISAIAYEVGEDTHEEFVSVLLHNGRSFVVDEDFETLVKYYESWKDFKDSPSNYAAF